MALKETSGNILEIGDRVKINLPALEKEVEEDGGDGIEEGLNRRIPPSLAGG